ncbi:MAG: hypothetical protein NT140_01820 [Deltaproteobacteria bacterium]|nr:hypothetical protein [Deltaproteobacteria bacterium]
MLRIYYHRTIMAIVFFLSLPILMYAAGGAGLSSGNNGRQEFIKISQAATKEDAPRPALSVTPREVDFGDVGPENVANTLIYMKNMGGGSAAWSIEGPEGWEPAENEKLTGNLTAEPEYLRLSIRSVKSLPAESVQITKQKYHNIQLTVEASGKTVIFRKDLPVGSYREQLEITSLGGTRTIFFNFKVTDAKSEPQLSVDPPHLDFGIIYPGKQAARQIRISNKGRETVKWRIVIPRPGDEKYNLLPLKGRYVSFLSDDIKGASSYVPNSHLKETLDISGKWIEQEGYPSAFGINNLIKYRFSGTGISLYLWHGPDGGKLAAYMDDQLIRVYDGSATERGREELTIADGLPDGPHVLTLVNGEGRTTIEGVSIYGKELMRGNPGWITINPDSGTTTRETDYANIRMDAQQLSPGFYWEQIVIASNRGDITLEAMVEIRPDQTAKIVDVYRYVRNHNYLYTTNPQAEANRIQSGGYRKEGIAFRLFAAGTPGTTEFNRWYNSKKDDHFYSYATNGGGKSVKDYVLEGSIGNIGTSKLSNTKELYRWFNQERGGHFYTTDPKGEGMTRKGYKFDGIAGYVR